MFAGERDPERSAAGEGRDGIIPGHFPRPIRVLPGPLLAQRKTI